jgi:hypothetical protein
VGKLFLSSLCTEPINVATAIGTGPAALQHLRAGALPWLPSIERMATLRAWIRSDLRIEFRHFLVSSYAASNASNDATDYPGIQCHASAAPL